MEKNDISMKDNKRTNIFGNTATTSTINAGNIFANFASNNNLNKC